MRSLLFASLIALAALPAQARTISFADAAVPSSGVLVLPVIKGKEVSGPVAAVDTITGGALGRAIRAAAFEGESGKSLNLYGVGEYSRILLIGVGDGDLDRRELEAFGGQVIDGLKGEKAPMVHVVAPASGAAAAHVAFGARLGAYTFDDFKKDKAPAPGAMTIRAAGTADAQAAWSKDWSAVADGVALARDLISTPSNIKSPEWFVGQARAAFQGIPNVTIEVLDVPAMQKLGMGAIIGVGQGSVRPPRMLIVRYTGAGTQAPLVFTGKGITFDTGGISLKEPAGMWRMRYDMAGAAGVTGTVLALAKRGAKVNAVAIAALAENMPDGNAIRPGDVLTAMSGKTIEVLNTDAEGRLVLADASWLAETRFDPRAIINLATLTGSARAALGDDYAASFSNNDALHAALVDAGSTAGEPVWRLPMGPSHAKAIKSDVADIKNVVEGGFAGASIGAQFIYEFVKPDTPWAHFDIAGVAWADGAKPMTPKGAVGWGVRLLDTYVRRVEAE